jgi:hypothetical protein
MRITFHLEDMSMQHEETRTGMSNVTTQAAMFTPRTPLGKRLWELRQQILTTDAPLLDWDSVVHEVRERRGEDDNGAER